MLSICNISGVTGILGKICTPQHAYTHKYIHKRIAWVDYEPKFGCSPVRRSMTLGIPSLTQQGGPSHIVLSPRKI